jgi:hypothetical protein
MGLLWYFLLAVGFLIVIMLSVPGEGAEPPHSYLMSFERSLNSGVPA